MGDEFNVNKISAEVISELAKNAPCFVIKVRSMRSDSGKKISSSKIGWIRRGG